MEDPPDIPIEDLFHDILAKAQRGLGLDNHKLASLSGVSEEVIASLKKGVLHEPSLRALATHLHLDPEALAVSARNGWRPAPISLPGLAVFNTPYHDIRVNAFLAWDAKEKCAIAFDTGSDASDMLGKLHDLGARLGAIFLTHTHPDHIADLDRLAGGSGHPPVFVNRLETHPGAETFDEGRQWHFGKLHVVALQTSGHSAGGTTYVISGLGRPVAIVGDAIFAGSMGGGLVSYRDALRNNRDKILTLADNTILCPGHGPLTTVAEEKANNPFYSF